MTRHGTEADPAVVLKGAGKGGNKAVKEAHELDGVETGGGGNRDDDGDDDASKSKKVRLLGVPPRPTG